MMRLRIFVFNTFFLTFCACSSSFRARPQIDYCARQAERTLAAGTSPDRIPNSVDAGAATWNYTSPGSWTCGFWPGELWYLYENTGDERWRAAAEAVTETIVPVGYRRADSHDVGFIMTTSLGQAYRLTGDEHYREAMLHAADSLAVLYNPTVGTLLSWPNMVEKMKWPHNTIIDNMMNLELLFWAAANGGGRHLYDIALRHAETTMRNHFREDGSCYHVAVYDPADGHFIEGVTHQGWRDDSMWARGQAWAIYGFTMVYRFTQDWRFLDFAQRVAEPYLDRLPEDRVPYWDFDAAEQSADQPRDSSAAAIVASALLELSGYVEGDRADRYRNEAIAMLRSLSGDNYRADERCSAFLLHAVGHMPNRMEVDASICYGDYYYLEALTRLCNWQEGRPLL